MADRVYPSAKPAANGTATGAGVGGGAAVANPAFPATKAQLYGASRPAYRPQPRRHRRSCCCSCCIWTTITILIIILLAAVAGIILYFLYRPHRPTFTVSALKVATLNLTSSSTVVSAINLDVTAKNPNKKIVFYYDPISVTVTTDDDIAVGDASFPSFTHRAKNTTLLKFAVKSSGGQLDDASVSKLRSEMRSKSGVPLKIKLETKVKAKMGALKTPKILIRVTCEGVKAPPPTGKTATTASTANAKCKVDWRVKIWKWTF
ncbi:hypothetical protein Ddye_013214 [Dipteronia dyeriana]|uniref:Late embryogenesis abundant protein LEA-2 subgroup domain-containing protein n=1 Tax=Dipteronia dyeriana TaxID=168575 RepID=A0AAD9X5U9_9ROSI|nr:hypothetical protein Ddye_013214 [Dipteronia dyeriana]